jgi:hypothetical protein
MAVARSIGLVSDAGLSGTIDQDVVLASISGLAAAHPGHDDLFAAAATRVQLARSAGVRQPDAASVFLRSPTGANVQLRYRTEMADVFTDLAIDIGLLDAARLADAPA